MMFMICCRVTPCLAVRITITSVVLGDGASEGAGDGASEGAGADGVRDCATAANGYAERMSGSKDFMDAPRISVCRLLVSGSVPPRSLVRPHVRACPGS